VFEDAVSALMAPAVQMIDSEDYIAFPTWPDLISGRKKDVA